MADNDVQTKQGGARVGVPPPLVFAAAILIGAFLPDLRPRVWLSAPPGAVLMVLGAALMGWALNWFRRSGQNPNPRLPSPELIERGPYRFMRNPMYVGLTLLTLGIGGLLARGWIALLAPAALIAVHYLAVLPEERYLTAKFGASYVLYKTRVRRYL